jgi:hypothetical protein
MFFTFSKLERPIYLRAFVLILSLSISVSVAAQTNNKKMVQTKKTKVAPGKWGAVGIGLSVEETAVTLEFDCATAEITRNLLVDKTGNFTAEGVYIRRGPGALRVKFPPKRVPARFEGKIFGKTMTLKITLTETGETIGEYTLQRGKTPAIRRCA